MSRLDEIRELADFYKDDQPGVTCMEQQLARYLLALLELVEAADRLAESIKGYGLGPNVGEKYAEYRAARRRFEAGEE